MTEEEIFSFEAPKKAVLPDKNIVFGVIGLAHGHIYSMVEGLRQAGAELKYVYEDDRLLLAAFLRRYPDAVAVDSPERIYGDSGISLIASAAIPGLRAGIAVKAMNSGKDFFVDKAPLISLEQLDMVRDTISETKRRYFVYYSESVTNAATLCTGELIRRGVIGNVFHIDGFGPHQLNPSTRADWFFDRRYTGGILIDLVCHQLHQLLCWCGTDNITVNSARTMNCCHREYDDFDDYGDLTVTADNGVTGFFRVDWSSPNGLGTWGDARMFIQGEKGYIELRKNCDICYGMQDSNIYLVTQEGKYHRNVRNDINIPFFRNLINDCIYRTETAVPADTALKAIEIAIKAQMKSKA